MRFEYCHRFVAKCRLVGLLLVALSGLCLLSPVASAQSASHALKMNPNAYTGKRAWWFNYQYFPELTIFGQSDDTIPDVKHRYSFYVNGGYAGFDFKQSEATSDKKMGLGLGFRYNHFITPHWGFRTGVGFDFSTTSSSMGALKDEYVKTDQEFDQVRYNYDFQSVAEDYRIYLLDVPLELVYQWRRLMAGAGVKVAFPVSVAYSQSMSGVTTTAYFPQYDNLVDDSWVLVCGHFNELKSDNKFMVAPLICMLTADLEYMIPVNRKYSVGVGAYIDYSISSSFSFRKSQLADELTDQESMLGTTNEVPVALVTNSLLSGKKNLESDKVVSNIKYFNAGIRISLNINSYGPPKPKTKPY